MDEQPSAKLAALGLLLLLATVLPWSQAVDAGSGTTPVEVASDDRVKLLVLLAGLLLALRYRRPGAVTPPVRLLVAYAVVALCGAYLSQAPGLQANAFRSVRYVLVALALSWLACYLGREKALRVTMWFAAVQGLAAVVAMVAGLRPQVDGRLAGYVPNLHPNSLAIVVGIGLTIALLRVAMGLARWEAVLVCPVLITAVILAGSRTTMGATLLGLTLLVLVRSARGPLVAWAGASIAFVVWLSDSIRGTNTFRELATRGGSAEVDSTFTGRTDGWEVALGVPDSLVEKLFGHGLALKEVTVPGAFVPTRGVDGSWHSAYLEGGAVGVLLLVAALLAVLFARANRSYVPLTAMLAVLFVLESQLNDVSIGMAALVLVASRARPDPRGGAGRSGDTVSSMVHGDPLEQLRTSVTTTGNDRSC